MSYYRELGYKASNGFRRNIFCTISSFGKEVRKIQKVNDNVDLFYSIFTSENKDFNQKILSPLYFDIDGEYSLVGLENTKLAAISLYVYLTTELKLKKEEIQFFFSGAKGFHVLVAPDTLGLKPEPKLNLKIRNWVHQIAKHVENNSAFDLKIYDARRLFRIPNSINSKTGLYKVPVTIDEIKNLNLPGLQELACNQRQFQDFYTSVNRIPVNTEAAKRLQALPVEKNTIQRSDHKVKIMERALPPCIESILSQSIGKGSRNNILIMLASALFQHSHAYQDVLETMMNWNAGNTPPLEQPEVVAACRSAYKMTNAGKGYGCSSIRNTGLISSNLCRESCEIFKLQTQRNNQQGVKYLGN